MTGSTRSAIFSLSDDLDASPRGGADDAAPGLLRTAGGDRSPQTARAPEFPPRSSLWMSLPEIGGWPIRVIECHGARHVAEFRVPLRPHENGEAERGVARAVTRS